MLEIILAHEHVHQLPLAVHNRRNGSALVLQLKPALDFCCSLRRNGACRQSCRLRRPSARQKTPNDIRRVGGNGNWILRGACFAYSAHTATGQYEHSRHSRGNPRIDPGKPPTLSRTLLFRRRYLLSQPVVPRGYQRGSLQPDAGSWHGPHHPFDLLQLVAPELQPST